MTQAPLLLQQTMDKAVASTNFSHATAKSSFGVYRKYMQAPTIPVLSPSVELAPGGVQGVPAGVDNNLPPSSSALDLALGPFPSVTSLIVQHTFTSIARASAFPDLGSASQNQQSRQPSRLFSAQSSGIH